MEDTVAQGYLVYFHFDANRGAEVGYSYKRLSE